MTKNLDKMDCYKKTDEGGQYKVKARLLVLGNMEEGLSSIQT